MKEKGINRKIDRLGRIVIPKEMRELLEIEEATQLELYVNNKQEIIIKKSMSRCYICGCESKLIQFKGKLICRGCINYIKNKGN